MKAFLKDKLGQKYKMEITDIFDGSVWDGEEVVAHIGWNLYTTKQMNLNEVYVRDDSYPLDGSICPATHPIGRGSCAGSYRNKGIGTELLKLAVNCARKRRLKFICASVTKEDISKTPYLLEWYERRGFKKSGRYKGCIPDAVAWVCMQLD